MVFYSGIGVENIIGLNIKINRLMGGFMSVTMLLSMFVSNTGACAMICPIVEALVKELFHHQVRKAVSNLRFLLNDITFQFFKYTL